ncbi:hypothetical protein I4U23_029611 [Adineta vaga]|nr:hypothetical protein I4U23_029611 [Adineta vaga]
MIDLAEVLPIVCVIFGFVAMVLVARAQNIPVNCVDSPYRIQIQEGQSTLKDGVSIRLHTDIRCQLRAFWFVNIQRFYVELDSIDFRMALSEDRFLQDHSIHQQTINFDTPGDYVQRIEFSDADNYVIKNNQIRRDYPLVLILHSFIDENSNEFFRLPIQIATLHIKSSIPTDPPTRFLGRISKLANGQSLVIQDIYTPGAFTSEDTCAICLTERVSYVLLPCKHALLSFFVALLVLFSFVQCRNVYTQTIDRDRRSLNNVRYKNLCMFRTNRLCDYLHELTSKESENEQQIWKRRTSNFFSNW